MACVAGNIIHQSFGGPVERYTSLVARVPALKGSILFLEIVHFSGMNKKQRSCDGWWGAQRPVRRGNEPKKTGARSAQARTRGQNPLVSYIHLGSSVCHPVCRPVIFLSSCHSCGTLSYSLCFNDQTDQGNETEILEMEGL